MFKHLSLLVVVFLGGCTTSVNDPARSSEHPANSAAPEATLAAPSQTLAITESPTTSPSDETASMGGMQHMQHGTMHDMSGMNHPMHGMMHDTPATFPATTQAAAKYTCQMHPEVISDQPGKCPKCGMKLVLKKGAR